MSVDSLITQKGILCDIYKMTATKDAIGGTTETFKLRTKDAEAFIQLLTGQEGIIGGQKGLTATHRFFFHADEVVERTDEIRVTRTFPGDTGETTDIYEDLFRNDPNDFGHHQEYLATLRK